MHLGQGFGIVMQMKENLQIIRDVYFVDAKGYNKIKGTPITKTELIEEIRKYL